MAVVDQLLASEEPRIRLECGGSLRLGRRLRSSSDQQRVPRFLERGLPAIIACKVERS